MTLGISCLSISTLPTAQPAPTEPLITDPVYTKPNQLVDVGGGRRLNLHCREAGSPAVIFDSGLNDSTIAWALVQPAISKTNATCSYDRAGMGFSDAANYKKPEELIGENGLLEQLTKLLVERAPDTEMAEHLGNI